MGGVAHAAAPCAADHQGMTTTTAVDSTDTTDSTDSTDTAQRRAAWSAQAQAWYTHLDVIERQWAPLTEGLLERARITTGDRVLDLGCGVGDPAVAAAARVGPTGTVVATDISPDMVAFAARRAAAAGLTNLEAHVMDIDAVDLPDHSVDAAVSRLGLMFATDLDAALSGVHRVLVPGGRFAAAITWRPQEHALMRLVGAVLGVLGRQGPAPADGPGTFALSDASVVCAALERAGFAAIRVEPYTVTHDFTSPDEWISFVLALMAPLHRQLAAAPAERQSAARRAAEEVAASLVHGDGHVRFPGHGYYATAHRPDR
jgi:SAM-dependent methyltransferase